MRFGVFFELQLPRPWAQNSELDLFQNALRWVEIADRIGIDYAWAQEHHFLDHRDHWPRFSWTRRVHGIGLGGIKSLQVHCSGRGHARAGPESWSGSR
jgi:alkanesulfonate monooxygenase SsuD/methylene tetrahydromethanopterin reductase-like flavin-dependent oxidoreductase (luciferase family)